MNKYFKYLSKKNKQDRSNERIEKILDSVESITHESTENRALTARSIADKGASTTGALYHHFSSIDNIFASLLVRKINLSQQKTISLIESSSANMTLNEFATMLVDKAFEDFKARNSIVLRLAIKTLIKNIDDPNLFFSKMFEPLNSYIITYIAKNESGTFKVISDKEWPLYCRTIQTAILSPFFEQLPIAGEIQHRTFVINLICNIYGNKNNER